MLGEGRYLGVGVGGGCVPLQGRACLRLREPGCRVPGAVLAALAHLGTNSFHILFDLLVFLGEVFRNFLRENI